MEEKERVISTWTFKVKVKSNKTPYTAVIIEDLEEALRCSQLILDYEIEEIQ